MAYRITKRDGSVVYAMRNPDGSLVEFSAEEMADRQAASAQMDAATSIRQFLRQIGRRGGQARAARHGHAELASWGRVRHTSKAIL